MEDYDGDMAQEKPMTVSRAARRAGLTPNAVGLYENKGLLDPAPRSGAGHRLYQDQDVDSDLSGKPGLSG